MNKDKTDLVSASCEDLIESHDPSGTEITRRNALKKIGKFSAYAAPSAIAILANKPAYPQGISSA